MSDYQQWKCTSCGHVVEMLYAHGKPIQCPCCAKKEFRVIGVIKK